MTGTLRTNRVGNPKEVIARKLEKGQMVWKSLNNIAVLKWKDKRNVHAITTAHQPEMITVHNRHGVTKVKPNVIHDYNQNMSGIDRSDQMLSYHSALRKTIRWYKKVGVNIIEILIGNAHYLYKKYALSGANSHINNYKESVVRWLVGDITRKQKPLPKSKFHYLSPIPPTDKKETQPGNAKHAVEKTVRHEKKRDICACYARNSRPFVSIHVS